MNWKLKSKIQNAISALPASLSYSAYYQLQRHFGGLKKPYTPINHIAAGIKILKIIERLGGTITNKVFFEVGTGYVPIIPVVYWLSGAKKTITVDLNPYMRKEIILDLLMYIKNNQTLLMDMFGSLLNKERFTQLIKYIEAGHIETKEFLQLCSIEYLAPGDATKTGLPTSSIHYHTSHTVYEHIPLNILDGILVEGNRIITEDGLFINCIDYADHFSYMDSNISGINFLQYSNEKWDKYAGNKYMYMNRLRHDDYLALFNAVNHEIIEMEPCKDNDVESLLRDGRISVDSRFKSKPVEVLAITSSWFTTKTLPAI